SRPHRVFHKAPHRAFEHFLRAVRYITQAAPFTTHGSMQPRAIAKDADARTMPLSDASVDFIVTSPPYLNAIDYLRGHKLSLVWMGWTTGALREIRAASVGVERGISRVAPDVQKVAKAAAPRMADLPAARQGMVLHFAHDMD